MSINPIQAASVMENVTQKVYELERDINSATDLFRRGGDGVSVSSAEHRYVYTYGDAVGIFQQIADLLRMADAPAPRPLFSTEELYRISHLETKMNVALRRLTNVLLTHFPTAQTNYSPLINYGPALIGPIMERTLEGVSTQPFLVRQIRNDGNAFLSAVATRFLEELVQQGVVESFIGFVAGFVAGTDCDPNLKQKITTMLRGIQANPSQLETTLQSNDEMLPFINFLRRVAAQEMLADKPLYESALRSDMQWIPSADGEQPYEKLVNQHVLQMGVMCVPSMMAAVCKMLAFQVCVNDSLVGMYGGRNILAEGAPRGVFMYHGGGNYYVRYAVQPTTTTTAPAQQPVAIQEATAATIEVAVKFNAGYGNNLFVRGNVPGMSWERGTMLRNTGADSWVFAIPSNARNCEFKLVLNDTKFENGLNRKVNNEGQIVNERREVESPIIPRFPLR